MTSFNLFADDWDEQHGRPGFDWKRTAVGGRIGGELLGASVYELPPGEKTWPYHFENANEEWLIVVAGTPTLREPDGERELAPGDTVCFPRGPAGAHQVINRSGALARVLILSTKIFPEVAEYPDSGKLGIWPGGRMLRSGPELDYWEGE